MSLADNLRGNQLPVTKKRDAPLWEGPESSGPNGGITFSLLSRFLVCRERFRLLVVGGLSPQEGFNHRLEYGNMWHVCEEYYSKIDRGNPSALSTGERITSYRWLQELQKHCQDLCRRYPTQQEQVDHWYRVCKVQFPLYVNFWAKHPEMQERTPGLQEQVFNVLYKLPSGRIVRLRGKWDSIDLVGEQVWLQENKTKGQIIEQQIKRQMAFDLQTMMYIVAFKEWSAHRHEYTLADRDTNNNEMMVGYAYPFAGVRYNVVRRPLSGGKGTIKQCKGETKDEYYARLAAYIVKEPETYFMRWNIHVSPADVQRFRRECLDPILEQLCDWWEWIRGPGALDPFDSRMGVEGTGKPHWRHPFGVYNVLNEGGSSDYDEHLASGSRVGLQQSNNLFPELSQE